MATRNVVPRTNNDGSSIGTAAKRWTYGYFVDMAVTNSIDTTATAAYYADLAEKYTSDKELEPGTVVCIGGSAEVQECDEVLCPSYAGVISTNPAFLMNKDLDGVSVALIGRVPAKVMGPVKKGDILVTAGKGCLKTGLPREIAFKVGVALEDKEDEGISIIEVKLG